MTPGDGESDFAKGVRIEANAGRLRYGRWGLGIASAVFLLVFVSDALGQTDVPSVAEPFSISDPVVARAPFRRSGPLLASNGDGFLAVWVDQRSDAFLDLVYTRLDAAGTVLDPTGVLLQRGPRNLYYDYYYYNPDAIFLAQPVSDGDHYIVLYGCSPSSAAVCLARITASGEIDRRIEPLLTGASSAALAWNGSRYLLVYATTGKRLETYGLFLDREGQRLGQPFLISGNLQAAQPLVASNGQGFYVAFRNLYEQCGRAVGALGELDDPIDRLASLSVRGGGANSNVSLTSDGRDYLLVWDEITDRPFDIDIKGRLIRDGLPSSPHTTLVSHGLASDGAVVWNGRAYVIVYSNPRSETVSENDGGVETVELDRELRIGEPVVVSDEVGLQTAGSVAWSGSLLLAGWYDDRHASGPLPRDASHIYVKAGRSAEDLANPDTETCISASVTHQEQLAAAAAPGRALVAWVERIDGKRRRVFTTTVDTARPTLSREGMPVSPTGFEQLFPAIEFDGFEFLMVWVETGAGQQTGTVMGARFDYYGRPLGRPFPIAPDMSISPVAVRWNGESYLVLSSRGRIFGTRVGFNGSVLDTVPTQISPTPPPTQYSPTRARLGEALNPAVAWDGVNFFVAYSIRKDITGCVLTCIEPYPEIHGIRVGKQGAPIDAEAIVIESFGASSRPSLTWNGQEYLVVWGGPDPSIMARRILPTGQLIDLEARRLSSIEHGFQPSVTWNGREYLLAWTAGVRGRVLVSKLDRQQQQSSSTYVASEAMEAAADPLLVNMGAHQLLVYQQTLSFRPYTGTNRILGQLLDDTVWRPRRRAVR